MSWSCSSVVGSMEGLVVCSGRSACSGRLSSGSLCFPVMDWRPGPCWTPTCHSMAARGTYQPTPCRTSTDQYRRRDLWPLWRTGRPGAPCRFWFYLPAASIFNRMWVQIQSGEINFLHAVAGRAEKLRLDSRWRVKAVQIQNSVEETRSSLGLEKPVFPQDELNETCLGFCSICGRQFSVGASAFSPKIPELSCFPFIFPPDDPVDLVLLESELHQLLWFFFSLF